MRSQYVGKNMKELQQSLDSLSVRIDSIGRDAGQQFDRNLTYMELARPSGSSKEAKPASSAVETASAGVGAGANVAKLNLDSLLRSFEPSKLDGVFAGARARWDARRWRWSFAPFR